MIDSRYSAVHLLTLRFEASFLDRHLSHNSMLPYKFTPYNPGPPNPRYTEEEDPIIRAGYARNAGQCP